MVPQLSDQVPYNGQSVTYEISLLPVIRFLYLHKII